MCNDDKVLDSDLFEGTTAPTLCRLMGVLRHDGPDSEIKPDDAAPDKADTQSATSEG